MTLHVGDLSSQVEVRGGGAAAGTGGSAGGTAPSWDERERMRRMMDEAERERQRVAGCRFDD